MSDAIVRLAGVGKMYKVFASRTDNLIDAVGLRRFMPWRRIQPSEFWALRAIDLELGSGQRVGVIGRNGAGKTTLLKLLTGNLAPTEGVIEIRGKVQPLMDLGAGFHPEFTGYENIRSSLTYLGLRLPEIEAAEADIADFTELGGFLGQPIKTYSLGMQARLAFATATAVKSEVLIIDEILGAGDAYFLGKSTERMRALVESGAAVIIVSHALDYITRFCEDAIWLDRGRIVAHGTSLEVVKAYQQFIQVLENRRLKAKSRKVRAARRYGSFPYDNYDNYGDTLLVRFVLSAQGEASCDVAELELWKGDEAEERLLVGSAQDVDSSHAAFVMGEEGGWSAPRETERGFCRNLAIGNGGPGSVSGTTAFNLYALFEDVDYAVKVGYRVCGSGELALEVWRNGVLHSRNPLPAGRGDWTTHRLHLGRFERSVVAQAEPSHHHRPLASQWADTQGSGTRAKSRWPGEGSLTIEEVLLLDSDGREQAVFHVGTPLTLRMTLAAHQSGTFEVLPAATLYRLDGILVSNHPGRSTSLSLEAGERRQAFLDLGPLNLGNGSYVFSVALFRKLASPGPSETYDLIDRSYEFQVIGNGPFENGVFRHPGDWRLA